MKTFSKYEAIGNGKPVVTRNGRKVTLLKAFELRGPFTIVGVIEGHSSITTWNDDGKYCGNNGISDMDLFMESAAKEGWVAFGAEQNQISRGLMGFATHVWPTEAEAVKSYKNSGREPKGTVKITWEE